MAKAVEEKNKNNGNGHTDQQKEIDALKAELKKATLNSKYKRVGEGSDEFNAEDFLFKDAQDNEHKREIVTSDVPVRMVPLLTNWETLIAATHLQDRTDEEGKIIRLSKTWISSYLLYRKPLDRQARTEAMTMGQEKQAQENMSGALRA